MVTEPALSKLLTSKDVAKALQVSRRRVYQLGLPRVVIGPRIVRYREQDVANLIQQRAAED